MNNKITLATIVNTLNRTDRVGQRAVTMAIIRLYERQTADEQQARDARHQNGRGFSAFDAKTGTYMAKWALNGAKNGRPRLLTGRWLHKARKMALKYKKQLLEIAQETARARARAAEQQRLADERARKLTAEHAAHIVDMLESEEEPITQRFYRNGPITQRSAVA